MKQIIIAIVLVCSVRLATGQTPNFTKVTSGIFVNDVGATRGQAWGDYDNNGYLDVFISNKFGNNFLYRNNGDGTFSKISTGSIVSDGGNTHTGTWGDYDNDGHIDLFAANWSDGGQNNFLYKNNGDGTFTKITSGSIVSDGGGSLGAAWGDINNDGFIDLHVANQGYPLPHNDFLYLNNGNGTFSRNTTSVLSNDGEYSVGGFWCDYDNDNRLDLFVATGGAWWWNPNRLYRNEGNGVFSRITTGHIVTGGTRSFGGSWADINNDGRMDILVTSDVGTPFNDLLLNNGDGTFTRAVSDPVVQDDTPSLGSAWGDFDNDGDLDLFVYKYYPSQNMLYINNGNGTFVRVLTGAIAEELTDPNVHCRSAAWVDYDNDGDLDLFVTRNSGDGGSFPNLMYRNDGNSNNWLKVRCVGTISNRSAIGAKVRIKATINGNPTWQSREVTSQSGALTQQGFDIHFGLGSATVVDTLRVEWPSGQVQFFANISPNQLLNIIESLSMAPTLLSPPSGAINRPTNPDLRWTKIIGASFYQLQVSLDSTFSMTLIDDSTIIDTVKSLAGLATNSKYFWRVRAKGALGVGVWSEEWFFFTNSGSGLVAQYPLDGNATDIGGYDNHGALHGSTAVVPDRFGNPNSAIRFDGASYGLIGNHASLQLGEQWTLTCWFTVEGPSPNDWIGVVSKAAASLDGHAGPRLMLTNPLMAGTFYFASQSLQTGPWYFGAMTAAGDSVRMFLNGQQVSAEVFHPSWSFSNTNALTLAGQNATFWGRNLNGKLDDVCIYNRPLTPSEIFSLYGSGVLPVQLSSFTALQFGRVVKLNWRTTSEINNYGFHVQRRRQGSTSWSELPNAFVPGHGTTSVPRHYSYIDSTLPGPDTWWYRLKQVDLDGSANYSEEINISALMGIALSGHGLDFKLHQNYPNPFNPGTTISYDLPKAGFVSLRVVNLIGGEVASLIEMDQQAGRYEVKFDASGLASGVYLYQLRTQGHVHTRKLVVMK